MIRDLSRYYKILTFEFPNQGESPTDVSFATMHHYAEFTRQFLRYIGILSEEVIAHGFSFGGNVLRHMSQQLSVRFKAIIYGGIASTRLAPFQVQRFKTWLSIFDQNNCSIFVRNLLLQVFSPDFIARDEFRFKQMVAMYESYYAHRPEAIRALILAMQNFFESHDGFREKYLDPVYLIGAESDLLMPINYIREYAREINASGIYAIPGGHGMRVEQPDALAAAIHDICIRHDD